MPSTQPTLPPDLAMRCPVERESAMVHGRCLLFTLAHLAIFGDFWKIHCSLDFRRTAPACSLKPRKSMLEYKSVQDGDIIIGGIFSVHYQLFASKAMSDRQLTLCMFLSPQYYRHFLAFVFAIDEINNNPNILPNVTLGYIVYDSCSDVMKAIEGVMNILSGLKVAVPNYSCARRDKVVGFIGDLSSVTSLAVAHILSVYGYPQISYGTTNPLLSEKSPYPSFFQTVQDDRMQYAAISELLLRLGWTWVGIITSADDSGATESQELSKQMMERKICIEFTIVLKNQEKINDRFSYTESSNILQNSTSHAVIICGSVSIQFFLTLEEDDDPLSSKTLIFSSSWSFNADLGQAPVAALNGSLVFSIPKRKIPGLQTFLQNAHPSNRPDDALLEDIWAQFFECVTPDQEKNKIFQTIYNLKLQNCSGNEHILDISNVVYDTQSFRTSYNVYTAGYIMAHALHDAYYSGSKTSFKSKTKLQHSIQKVNFTDPIGEDIYFNNKGAIPTQYHIFNHVVLANGTFVARLIGRFSMLAPEGQRLVVNTRDIIWKKNTNEVPRSQCSESCNPGGRKVVKKGKPICCYDCVRCSEGEISTEKDVDVCIKCPENQWPNERSDMCLPKILEFLSYEMDFIASLCSFFSIFFSILSAVVLALFIQFRDTPVVKANNRTLSFILLISLSLSFLCVLLFIGRPVDITCMLRQTSFAVIFTVAVSSVLAKTVVVCIAFKATRPGKIWKKWAGAKLSYAIVLSCSIIQICICISWLGISPPFQDVNMHSHPGKIIIKCNEGSPIGFYCALGYIGFLAAVSFVAAFLVRSLPDSFNEGKYITFSMLVFCCVWVCAVPAYLSTEGKNTVATEIFAILASSAGLLTCIFSPKCYIVLMKPHMNTKKHLLGKIKA
ncbi:vomeronasal type-2 receptor 26-like [Spea bombifrons]|uniref:vomeronasal type-2 receptor 26-like n=1 Tax=Spea bombifrons TaxID=233779 RepID=UPI00234AEE36|nr:vomeronasal type-2 receptor 26-like [Spea bombifrons]